MFLFLWNHHFGLSYFVGPQLSLWNFFFLLARLLACTFMQTATVDLLLLLQCSSSTPVSKSRCAEQVFRSVIELRM